MTTPTVTETRRHGGRVGERVELARYSIPAGERILYRQRIDGVVRVTDCPSRARAARYSSSASSNRTATPLYKPSSSTTATRHDATTRSPCSSPTWARHERNVARAFLADALTADGYEVDTAVDRGDPLAQLRASAPDLILADVNGRTLTPVDWLRD